MKLLKNLEEMHAGVHGLDNFDRAVDMINSAVDHHERNDNFDAIADVEGLVQFLKGQYHDFTPALEDSVREIIADELGHDKPFTWGEEEEEKEWKAHMAAQKRTQAPAKRNTRNDFYRTSKRGRRHHDAMLKAAKHEEEESFADRVARYKDDSKALRKKLSLDRQRRKYSIHGPSRRSGGVRRKDLGGPRGTFGLEQEEVRQIDIQKIRDESKKVLDDSRKRKMARDFSISGPSRRGGGIRRRDLGKPRGTFGLEQEEQEVDNWHVDWNSEVDKFRERRKKHEPEGARSSRISDRIRNRRRNTPSRSPFSVEQEEVTSLSDRRARFDQFKSDVRGKRRGGHRHSDSQRQHAQLMARKARPHVGLEQEEENAALRNLKRGREDRKTNVPGHSGVGAGKRRRMTLEPKYARRSRVRFESFKQFNEMYRDSQHGLTIDLSGPEGNAFALMGHAKSLARQLEWDGDKIVAEMQEDDYNHLVATFEKYFKNVVTLINKPGEETDDWDE